MNKLDLHDRVAVITGGSGGIGLAIAERFVASGAKVVLRDINVDAANAAGVKIDAALASRVDVTNQQSVANAARDAHAKLGAIDILINSAGNPNQGAYSASKAGVIALTKSLATSSPTPTSA